MITLEKILTELKPESLNEIVGGHGRRRRRHKGGRKGKHHSSCGTKKSYTTWTDTKTSGRKSYTTCY